MIKRTLYFGNAGTLRLKDKQMSIEVQLDGAVKTTTIPVEDIGIVILDHQQLLISHALIQALQENNVALITCDQRHMPQSLTFPLEGNTLQQERYENQIAASEPLKKQLWAQTISQKIKNQMAVLRALDKEHEYLHPLYKNVKSGDADNHEATAASFYWQKLFGHIDGFVRQRSGPSPNELLNYGYAILRGTVARSIVGAGLIPTLGLFHKNRYNAFCLADDLMEPYRPYIDLMVYQLVAKSGIPAGVTKEVKAELLKIPVLDVKLDDESSPLMLATQRTAVSLVKCLNGEQRKLLFPQIE
ncbi:MAG: type II CRISPR-associated endonuclease Cas1 [Crocinitomicaceae bacterium]|nr:type II CRISPR-associated endonuclease Cas1 [Crocinitomicaceae bacterium]MBK8927337.1 type II CRISPR-associated endonuclease Cas1 [Crocinitomicaceae bacterium]